MTVFLDSFGHTRERVVRNYTDDRWFIVLERFLFEGMEFVLRHTLLYEDMVSRVLATDTKKKLYGAEAGQFHSLALAFFQDGPHRLELLREMRINRALLLGPLRHFAEARPTYYRALFGNLPMVAGRLREQLMLKEGDADIVTALQRAADAVRNFNLARDMFLEKWHKALLTQTHRFIKQYPNIPEDDIAGFCYGALIAAFNKFDHERGTFGSLVQRQMGEYSRKAIVTAEMGNAYSLNLETRKAVARGESDASNIAQTFPDEEAMETFMDGLVDKDGSYDDELAGQEEAGAMLAMVERMDAEGWFRLLNGIEMDHRRVFGLWQ